MRIPERVQKIIESECGRNGGKNAFISLLRRADSRSSANEDGGFPSPYDVMPENKWEEVLQPWYEFHGRFSYDSFPTFYSKAKFCAWLQREYLSGDPEKAKEVFLKLLADRRFFFLEFNEHLNAPEYPALSEIVRKPNLYSGETEETLISNANEVKKRGFVPTYAHRGAYKEMLNNYEDLICAIHERERCRTKDQELGKVLGRLYQTETFAIRSFDAAPSPLEEELCSIYKDFMVAATNQAYVKRYKELVDPPQQNCLPAIHSLLSYIEKEGLQQYSALFFFHLFTQKTTKLAQGKLKEYKFAAMRRPAANKPRKETQDVARKKIEIQIILFDHLLRIFSPEDPGFIKYLFCQYTHYYGYCHYDVSRCLGKKFFCLPNARDSVDHLAGIFRHHIQYCIPNEVNWLTPGLPNDRMANSEALATFLMRDAAFLPVYTRLTDRVRRCLNDTDDGSKIIREYQAACMDQQKTRELLNGWCKEYRLEFTGEDIAGDLHHRPESFRQICSRFVLEYALKEQICAGARKNLSDVAQALFGELCVEGEVF